MFSELLSGLGSSPERAKELLAGLTLGCTCYAAFYAYVSRRVLESKRRAWVPTCLAATVSTAVGALVGADILRNHWSSGTLETLFVPRWSPDVWITETRATKFLCVNFLSFLIVDVGLGVFQYAKHFHVLEGWVHHAVYAGFLAKIYLQGMSSVFAPFTVEELPTLILGLGTIDSRLRTDNGFGLTFFLTRILWHFFGVYNACTAPAGHPIRKEAWFGVVSMALHLHWFAKWIRKYLLGKPKKDQ